ncbi:gamma-glutamyltransferase family protein [Bacillus sp. FJAT-27231]|uniref:gamma-glutamyltransferase family protein n=1 Tax=Bacillus sp. FJAT-27231 TaxID=1679168 RepID=UPI0009E62DF8|nr:gamma-glutamyltransferase [Bacillus sp. FJAT-27231]
MNFHTLGKLIVLICLLINLAGCASTSPLPDSTKSRDKKTNEPYGVSSSNPIAIDAGMRVLENGGNAVDAAIAISYVLGVVEPFGSGLGGGGGMLIAPVSGEPHFIDYRETAPSTTEGESYSGIPGLVAGMQYAHDQYGSLTMKTLLQPAIDYAENGFRVDDGLNARLANAKSRVYSSETSLFYPNGKAIKPGQTLIQKDLAKTLKIIQKEGPDGFYKGEIAQDIKEITNISLKDLKKYQVKEHRPVQGTFAGYDVYTAPPPFSGVTLLQMLKLAEETNLSQSPSEAKYLKEMSAIIESAYEERSEHIADDVDAEKAERLIESDHITKLKNDIRSGRLRNERDNLEEHESTTHFVVIDKEGTVVSTTNTLSNFFGSGNYTNGFFLNDQLKNFGESGINAREPFKRSRTFTAPTVLKKQGEETIGIGSPGGNRIPQILMQVLYSYTTEENTFQTIIDRGRFAFKHNSIYTEFLFSKETTKALEKDGFEIVHKVSPMYYGGVQVLLKNEENNTISGAGDPRRNGSWKAEQQE